MLQNGSYSKDFLVLSSFSVVNCGDPGLYHFSERSGNDFDYNMDVNYTCAIGFITSDGNDHLSRTCEANGEWSQLTLCEGNNNLFPIFNIRTIKKAFQIKLSIKNKKN